MYTPTQAEIRAECKRIQQTWSEAERRRRVVGRAFKPRHWQPPRVRSEKPEPAVL